MNDPLLLSHMLGNSVIDSCRTLHVHINLSAAFLAFLACSPTVDRRNPAPVDR